nr:hypothetical protein [uncultured Duganella sp.]
MSAGVVRDYAPLFHQLFAGRRPWRGVIVIACLTAAAQWFAHAVIRRPAFGAFVCSTMVLGMAVAWCALFAASAVRQNHPANACLVPHLRRRLIVCCVALSAASALAVAGAVGIVFGYHTYFGLALAGAGLVLPLMLFAHRFVTLLWVPVALFTLASQGPWMDRLADWLLRQPQPAVLLVGVAFDAALLALAVRVVLPQGGERHIAWQEQLWNRRNAVAYGTSAPMPERLWAWRPGLARTAPAGGATAMPPGGEMLRALGPTVSANSHLMSIVLFALVAAAVIIGGFDASGGRLIMFTSILRATIALSVGFYVKALLSAMAARAGEQELYRLTPGAPAACAFNGALARAAMRRFALVWVATLAALLVLDFARTGVLLPSAATLVLAAAALLFARLPLRDYARWRPAPPGWGAVAASFAAMFGVLGGGAVIDKYPAFPWWALAAVIAVVALVLVRRRWSAMLRAAPAFPAGRMAA